MAEVRWYDENGQMVKRFVTQDAEGTWSLSPAADSPTVSLSVHADNWPRIPPLRAAYELREPVRTALEERAVPKESWPTATGLLVARELARVHDAIDRGVGVRIAIETINGMAKMAPMTERHLREAAAGE